MDNNEFTQGAYKRYPVTPYIVEKERERDCVVHYFVLIRYSHDGWSVREYTLTHVQGFYVPDHSFQLIHEDKTGATIYFYVYYTPVTRWERI